MANFHDTALPDALAMAVRREQSFRTQIVEAGSGFEFRNAAHALPRRHYTLDTGPRPLVDLQNLARFFEARRGRQYGFLLRDWLEPHSGTQSQPMPSDQKLLPLGAEGVTFGLIKTYSQGGASWQRRIHKPEADSVQVTRGQVPLVRDVDFTLDANTGIVRLAQPLAANENLTAGFAFYVPVRFDADTLEMSRVSAELAHLSPMPLVEISLPEASL